MMQGIYVVKDEKVGFLQVMTSTITVAAIIILIPKNHNTSYLKLSADTNNVGVGSKRISAVKVSKVPSL